MRGGRLANLARAAALGAVATLVVAASCASAPATAHAVVAFIPSSADVGYHTPDTPLFDRWGTWRFEVRYPTRVLPTVRHPVTALENSLANILIGSAMVLARTGVFLLQIGLKTTLATDALGAVAGAVSGLRERVFFPLLPLALLTIAGYAVWQGVVQRGHAEVVRTLLLVSLVFAVGLYFTENVEAVVGGACQVMDRMAVYFTAALAAPGQTARGCDPDSIVMLGCEKLWAVAVQNPWAWGTYGRPDYPDPVLVSDAEAVTFARKSAAAAPGPGGGSPTARITPGGAAWGVGLAQAIGGGQVGQPGGIPAGGISAAAGTAWTVLFSRHAPGSPERDILVDVLGDPGLDHGDHPASPEALGVAGALTQALLGAVAFGAAALLLAVAVLYGGGMLMAQVMVVALTVIAPVAFLYGLTPAGWQALKKWAFLLAGAVVTRFVYAGALGLLFLLVGTVEGAAAGPGGNPTPTGVFVSGAMVTALLVGAIVLRGRLVHGALSPLVAISGVQAWRGAGGAAVAPAGVAQGAWRTTQEGMDREAARVRRTARTAAVATAGAAGVAGAAVTSEQQVAQAADELLAWRLAQSRARHEAVGERDALLEEAELRERQGLGPLSEARKRQAREEIHRLMESEGLGPGEAAAYLRARDDIEFERAFLGRRAAACAEQPGTGEGPGAPGAAEAAGRTSAGGQPRVGAGGRRARRLEQFEEARRRAQEYARQYAATHSWRATRPVPRAYRGVRNAASSALGWFRRRLGRGS